MNEKPVDMVLRTKINEFELEVRIVDTSDIESAFLSLLNAQRELREIQEKHSLLILADSSRIAAAKYWIRTDEEPRITNLEDKASGIMLSLLESYPKTKMVKTIVNETSYTNSTVSDYLNGITGGKGFCFETEDKKWKLTYDGLLSISKFLKTIEDPTEKINPEV
ncbi:MAG: hypothetical protein ACTSYJ_09985 [Candidatus Thorarchaeota archaeon]